MRNANSVADSPLRYPDVGTDQSTLAMVIILNDFLMSDPDAQTRSDTYCEEYAFS
jgi:hypothetical protein